MDDALYKKVISIIASGVAKRGVTSLATVSRFKDALDLLIRAKRVAIVSGFYISSASAPETDGPGGTVALGRALLRSSSDVSIWTDTLCYDVMRSCSDSIKGPVVERTSDSKDILNWGPDLIVYLERVGRASDGSYYNMRSLNIDSTVVPLDDAAHVALEKGIPVIAIGDGGNEAGMGLLYDDLCSILPDYRSSLSVVSSDVVLPVDVSDWGGYGLALLLSCQKKMWLGVGSDEVQTMLEAQLSAGAVDGITLKGDLSVDGFSLEVQRSVVDRLKALFQAC